MRKHDISSHSGIYYNLRLNYNSCTVLESSVTDCSTPSTELTDLHSLTKSMNFISCKWRSCDTGGAGAALHCTGSDTVLTIKKCSFISCSADHEGGAIHTSSIHTLDVKESFFYKCSTSTTGNDGGSGAIKIQGIQHTLSLLQTDFISCISKASGGASIIQGCSSSEKGSVIRNCRYIDCNATDTSPDGGAVWIRSNSALLAVSSCHFILCTVSGSGGDGGGGVDYWLPSYADDDYAVSYCLFHKNDAVGLPGKDISLLYSQSNPIFHSLTTSPGENRVSPQHWDEGKKQDDWLPLVLLLHVSAKSTNLSRIK